MTYVVVEGSVSTPPTLTHRSQRSDGGRPFVVGNFLLVVRDRIRTAGGWKDTERETYDVAALGDLGRRVSDLLRPGDRVVVAGTVTKHRRLDVDPENVADDPDQLYNRRLEADHVGISVRFLEASEYTRRPRAHDQTDFDFSNADDPWTPAVD